MRGIAVVSYKNFSLELSIQSYTPSTINLMWLDLVSMTYHVLCTVMTRDAGDAGIDTGSCNRPKRYTLSALPDNLRAQIMNGYLAALARRYCTSYRAPALLLEVLRTRYRARHSQLMHATYRPMPRRYGMDRAELQELGGRVRAYRACPTAGSVRYRAALAIVEQIDEFADPDEVEALVDSVNVALDAYHRLVYGECSHLMLMHDAHSSREGYICEHCADSTDWVIPEDRGVYYPVDVLYEHDNGCYYTYEEETSDDEDYDEEESTYTPGMRSYTSDVRNFCGDAEFRSSSTGRFTIGVEVEVESAPNGRADLVRSLTEQIGGLAIFKTDGSLSDVRGLEIVTKPLEYREAIEAFSKLAFPRGTKAWDARCCGTHVHIDSRAFSKLALAKFVAFWNSTDNAEFIRSVAGRHPDRDVQAADYAARYEGQGSNIVKKLGDRQATHTRYRLINLTNLDRNERWRLGLSGSDEDRASRNGSTVEVRVFRASLRKPRLLAQIEMAAASVYFSRDASMQALNEAGFRAWLAGHVGMFPNLAAFIGLCRQHKANPAVTPAVDETVTA